MIRRTSIAITTARFTSVALTAAMTTQAAFATMTPNLPRGEKIVQRSNNEVCIIPQKIAGGKYTEKDIKNEIALCDSDVNGATQNIAICGKTTSTNPGVEFFTIPTGMTAAQVEAKNCILGKTEDPKNEFNKVAKYKNSTSCSYTPAILSYYHLSRYLGHVNQVPVAVLRTMDLKRHIQVGNKTMAYLKSKGQAGDTIGLTWGSLLKFLNQGAASQKKDVLFTDDIQQTYGALSKNPKNEEKYSELYNGGATQDVRAVNFRDKNPVYKMLKSGDSTKSFIGGSMDQTGLQKFVQMKNVADMIVLDTVLSQEDRFGNLHFTEVYYYIENNQVMKESSMKPEEIAAKKAIKVKELMMKDNDCGVNRTNHLKNARLLEGIRHINPETYSQLQKLNLSLATEEAKTFFRRETMMTEKDFELFRTNVAYAAGTLKKNCQSSSLKLDLDLDSQYANKPLTVSCE